MNNRRQTYRHPFVESEKVRVELLAEDEPTVWRGELVDLSIEGMKVRFTSPAAFDGGEQLTTRLIARPTPLAQLRLSILGQVKYVLQVGFCTYLGIQFLQAASLPLNERRENTLGRFLAEEQRRLLRRRLPLQDA